MDGHSRVQFVENKSTDACSDHCALESEITRLAGIGSLNIQ